MLGKSKKTYQVWRQRKIWLKETQSSLWG